ncbi:hypothetical protein Hamer_G002203 [Homarus americanus]|uniref:Uncharacterized protein n=1 Tax=Homarus americanus TaxID=6706 RepID=A0A8J5JRT3_HOMAM|nr:hypothetical protein Hamer_G002203 [Homarus americanus]
MGGIYSPANITNTRSPIWWARGAHNHIQPELTTPTPRPSTHNVANTASGWDPTSGGKVEGTTVMASCWRGMGVLLGTCVPSRPTDPHPAHTPTPRVAHPSPTPPSTGASGRTLSGSPSRSRHHHHQQHQQEQHQSSEGAGTTCWCDLQQPRPPPLAAATTQGPT